MPGVAPGIKQEIFLIKKQIFLAFFTHEFTKKVQPIRSSRLGSFRWALSYRLSYIFDFRFSLRDWDVILNKFFTFKVACPIHNSTLFYLSVISVEAKNCRLSDYPEMISRMYGGRSQNLSIFRNIFLIHKNIAWIWDRQVYCGQSKFRPQSLLTNIF